MKSWRRPSVGRRIMRGILLIWQKMTINIKNGYIPSWWTDENLQDVRLALKYLGKLYDWYEAFHAKEDDHAGETKQTSGDGGAVDGGVHSVPELADRDFEDGPGELQDGPQDPGPV